RPHGRHDGEGAGVGLFVMMRYPADVANRPSMRIVIRVEAKRERGGAHRRAVTRGSFALPSYQNPLAPRDEFDKSIQRVRSHSGNALRAMPASERGGDGRRIDRTIATRDRLASRER